MLSATRRAAPSGLTLAPAWVSPLRRLATVWAALLILFARDAADIVAIWWTSSTFGHCLFIPPLIGWLIWQRRDGLAQLVPIAWRLPLLLVAAGAGGWLLGEAGGVALARHLGLALMLQGATAAVLGRAVTRAILFPLAYLLFLVPMGEELVPPLQTLTAKMCMGLLALAGIPATIDGVFITTPGGWFEVAEACSGVKFLVAMVAFGALVAHVGFRSAKRRALFMAAAIIVPVLANGVRAFGTIWIAGRTGLAFADSFDHIIYGWFFFGAVMALLLGGAWRFFDRRPGDPWFDPAALHPVPPRPHPRRGWRIAAAAVVIAAAPLLWSGAMAAAGETALPDRIRLPDVPGWSRVRLAGTPWSPSFAGPDHSLLGRYRDADGREVDLGIAVYARQAEGRELVGYGQGAVGPDSDWAWASDAPAPTGGRAERITGPNKLVREVVSFYRVGDVTTGSAPDVKLETLRVRLLGGRSRAAAVLLSAEERPGHPARAAIDAFLRDLGPVDRFVDATLAR